MTGSAPGGWSPYGGPLPDEPAAQRSEPRRPPWFLATLAILEFFVIVALAGWLYWKYHHDKTNPAPAAGVRSLSHQAVEQYITGHFQATGVTCNGGTNVPLTSNGATFRCTASHGDLFVVTVTDKQSGAYSVRPVSAVQSTPPAHHPAAHHHKHHKKKH